MLGVSVDETSATLQYLQDDIDIFPKDSILRLTETPKVETSCNIDGMVLGLQKILRVSPKTNSSVPSVVCGAFGAIFSAVTLETGKADDAGNVFWTFHHGKVGDALAS